MPPKPPRTDSGRPASGVTKDGSTLADPGARTGGAAGPRWRATAMGRAGKGAGGEGRDGATRPQRLCGQDLLRVARRDVRHRPWGGSAANGCTRGRARAQRRPARPPRPTAARGRRPKGRRQAAARSPTGRPIRPTRAPRPGVAGGRSGRSPVTRVRPRSTGKHRKIAPIPAPRQYNKPAARGPTGPRCPLARLARSSPGPARVATWQLGRPPSRPAGARPCHVVDG